MIFFDFRANLKKHSKEYRLLYYQLSNGNLWVTQEKEYLNNLNNEQIEYVLKTWSGWYVQTNVRQSYEWKKIQEISSAIYI